MNFPAAQRHTYVPQRDVKTMVVLVRGDEKLASWPLTGGGCGGLEVVDELARFQLTARRLGCAIRLRRPCPELVALIELVGLRSVLETIGETEGCEEVGVEEVVVPDDPVA